MRKAIQFILIISVFASCKSPEKTNKAPFSANNPVIVLQKTVCFGKCPVYTLTLQGNSQAQLKGEMHLDKIGIFSRQLPEGTVEELVQDFEKLNFFNLQDEYTASITDLPTTYISFTYQGKTKKIKDYYGAPADLKALEKKIANLLQDDGWVNENK